MSNEKHSRIGSIIGVMVSILIFAAAGWVVLNAQYIFDQLRVWQYQPSTAVASIYDRSGLSNKGQFYFYASNPVVDSATTFDVNCQKQEAKSAILGCYSLGKIYIREVTNRQLDGIEEVTAAHETLHVIWERMSDSDKKSVGTLLEAEYQKINSPALKERMAYYDRNEPGEHFNELHSILGTEVPDLGSALEAHYGQYFANRSKVIALHSGYQQLFDSVQTQADTLLAELNALVADLNTSSVQYNDDAASISADSTVLKNRASSVDRTSASEVNAYNAARQALIVRINQLEALRAAIDAKSETYRTKLAEYNKLVVQSNELMKSLDGTLASPPSL